MCTFENLSVHNVCDSFLSIKVAVLVLVALLVSTSMQNVTVGFSVVAPGQHAAAQEPGVLHARSPPAGQDGGATPAQRQQQRAGLSAPLPPRTKNKKTRLDRTMEARHRSWKPTVSTVALF